MCICVFVFLYLDVRHLGTLFLRSSYHYLMLGLLSNLTQTVFVYLYICICVFECKTPGNIVFEVLVPFPFQKYITSWVFSGFFLLGSSAVLISGMLGMGLGSLCGVII